MDRSGILTCVVGLLLMVIFFVSMSRRSHYPKVEYKILHQYRDGKGRPVFEVQANDYNEASRAVEGWTYPGGVMWIVSRTGTNQWKIYLEDYHK